MYLQACAPVTFNTLSSSTAGIDRGQREEKRSALFKSITLLRNTRIVLLSDNLQRDIAFLGERPKTSEYKMSGP